MCITKGAKECSVKSTTSREPRRWLIFTATSRWWTCTRERNNYVFPNHLSHEPLNHRTWALPDWWGNLSWKSKYNRGLWLRLGYHWCTIWHNLHQNLHPSSNLGIQDSEWPLMLHWMSWNPCKSFICDLTSYYWEKFLSANSCLLLLGMWTTISPLSLSVHYFSTSFLVRNTDNMGSYPPVRLLPHIGRRSGEVLEPPAELGFGVFLPELLFGTLRPYPDNAGVLLVNLQPKQNWGEYSDMKWKRYWREAFQMLVSIHLWRCTRKWQRNIIILFLQLSWLGIISPIPSHCDSGRRCLYVHSFRNPKTRCQLYFSFDKVILIMRVHTLYEWSHKVLALYTIVVVVIMIVGCVSLNFVGDHDLASHSISDLVVRSGRYWLGKQTNVWMCRYKLVVVRISLEKGKYLTHLTLTFGSYPSLPLPSEPFVSFASSALLTLRHPYL